MTKEDEQDTEEDETHRNNVEAFNANSIFLNKALLTIPTAFTPFLFYSLGFFDKYWSKIFIFASCIAFVLSVLIMIWSFFKGQTLMERLIAGEIKRDQVSKCLGKINKLVYLLIILGFLCVVIAVYLEYIYPSQLEEKFYV